MAEGALPRLRDAGAPGWCPLGRDRSRSRVLARSPVKAVARPRPRRCRPRPTLWTVATLYHALLRQPRPEYNSREIGGLPRLLVAVAPCRSSAPMAVGSSA